MKCERCGSKSLALSPRDAGMGSCGEYLYIVLCPLCHMVADAEEDGLYEVT